MENWNQGVKVSSAASPAWVPCRSHSAVLLISEKPPIISPATCVLFLCSFTWYATQNILWNTTRLKRVNLFLLNLQRTQKTPSTPACIVSRQRETWQKTLLRKTTYPTEILTVEVTFSKSCRVDNFHWSQLGRYLVHYISFQHMHTNNYKVLVYLRLHILFNTSSQKF